jgi:hypothetical protein
MNNKPMALTSIEIKEIAAIEAIREMWGAENAAEMEELLDTNIYAVKFHYMSGGLHWGLFHSSGRRIG